MKIEDLKAKINNISEPRRTSCRNIRHKLKDIIIIGFCTILYEGKDYTNMEDFGINSKEYLAKFLELPNGEPDVS